MTRTLTLLAVATTLVASSFSSVASACPRGGRQVTYSSKPAVTHIVQQTVVTEQAAAIVEAVVVQPALPELTVGKTITAAAKFLGKEAGHVFVQLGSATIECEVLAWSSDSVTFQMPSLGLAKATPADVELVRPNGDLVRSFRVALVPPAALVEVASIATVATNEVTVAAPTAPVVEETSLITQ